MTGTKTVPHKKIADVDNTQDDTDADAFAVLSLLVIAAAALVYYLSH